MSRGTHQKVGHLNLQSTIEENLVRVDGNEILVEIKADCFPVEVRVVGGQY
jgi:hypothetical protein